MRIRRSNSPHPASPERGEVTLVKVKCEVTGYSSSPAGRVPPRQDWMMAKSPQATFPKSSPYHARKTAGGFGVLILSLSLLSGCDQKQRTQWQSSLERQAQSAAQSVQDVATKTAEQTLQETMTATRSGGATLRVKTALAVSSRLDGARIDVELQGQKIVLRGDVPMASQKVIAQNIAKNTLDPKFKIVNRLAVIGSSRKQASKQASHGKPGQRLSRRSDP